VASGDDGGWIPGIIDGSMTIGPEPHDGGLSLRIIIGTPGPNSANYDLLELIIRPEHIANLGRVLADYKTRHTVTAQRFPCHIGFCSNAVKTVA
jgi:hypothetical protein